MLEFHARKASKEKKNLTKNTNHDEGMIAKHVLVAKIVVVGSNKTFICPVTGDASTVIYALPVKKNGVIK